MDDAYSNFDHVYEYGFKDTEKMIRENSDHYFSHSAWDFYGKIWFENGKFHEIVMRYHNVVDEIENEKLDDLIEEVNEKWGYR